MWSAEVFPFSFQLGVERMVETFDERYKRVLALVKAPTRENWFARYENGIELRHVQQGRKLVVETPLLPELASWLDLENPTASEAWRQFVAHQRPSVKFAVAYSGLDWRRDGNGGSPEVVRG